MLPGMKPPARRSGLGKEGSAPRWHPRNHDRPAGGLPAGVGRDADAEAVPACMIVRVVPLFYWLDLLLDGLLDRLCWNHGWKLTFRDAGNSFADYRRSLHLVSDLKTAPPFKDAAIAMDSAAL